MFHVITQDNCIWCDKVKALLTELSHDYTEWKLPKNELKTFATIFEFNTVPQVFHGGDRIGGYELTKLYLEDLRHLVNLG